MAKNKIKINLDDVVLEIIPIAYAEDKDSCLCSIQARVVFPDGRKVETGFRYDFDKRWIIDPILQDDDLKQYVEIDETKYLVSKSQYEFISMDDNFEKWRNYLPVVCKAVAEQFDKKKFRMKYRSR